MISASVPGEAVEEAQKPICTHLKSEVDLLRTASETIRVFAQSTCECKGSAIRCEEAGAVWASWHN